jgi:hypothetical protein
MEKYKIQLRKHGPNMASRRKYEKRYIRDVTSDYFHLLSLSDSLVMDLGEIGWDGRDWIELAQDRDQWRALVNKVMDLRVP